MVRWSAGPPVHWSGPLRSQERQPDIYQDQNNYHKHSCGKIWPKLYINGGTPRTSAVTETCLIGEALFSLAQRPVSFRHQLKCPQSLVLVAHSDACVGHRALLVVSDHRRRSSHPKLHSFYLIIWNSAGNEHTWAPGNVIIAPRLRSSNGSRDREVE